MKKLLLIALVASSAVYAQHPGTENQLNQGVSGNGPFVITGKGPLTVGYCVKIDSDGNYVAASGPCGTGSGNGDASTNTATSADGEVALFSGTGGKTFKRATGSGIGKLTSGVLSAGAACADLSNAASSCSANPVGAGTATHMAGYSASGSAIADFGADLVFDGTHTYSAASTAVLDFSGASSHKIPVAAGCAPTAAGAICHDSTQGSTRIGGGTGTVANGGIPRVFPPQTSSTDTLVAATINVTETVFATAYTIPANFFIANKQLRVTWTVAETSSGTPVTTRMRIRYGGIGGTIIFDSSAVTPTASIVNRSANFTCILTGTAAPGASVALYTGCTGQGFASPATTPFNIANTVAPNISVATNASAALTMTMQYGGNTAGNTNNIWVMTVEELN